MRPQKSKPGEAGFVMNRLRIGVSGNLRSPGFREMLRISRRMVSFVKGGTG